MSKTGEISKMKKPSEVPETYHLETYSAII